MPTKGRISDSANDRNSSISLRSIPPLESLHSMTYLCKLGQTLSSHPAGGWARPLVAPPPFPAPRGRASRLRVEALPRHEGKRGMHPRPPAWGREEILNPGVSNLPDRVFWAHFKVKLFPRSVCFSTPGKGVGGNLRDRVRIGSEAWTKSNSPNAISAPSTSPPP